MAKNVSIAVNPFLLLESIRKDYKEIISLHFKKDRTEGDNQLIKDYVSSILQKEKMVKKYGNASPRAMRKFNDEMENINSAVQVMV